MSSKENLDTTNFAPDLCSTKMEEDFQSQHMGNGAAPAVPAKTNIRRYKELLSKLRNREFESAPDGGSSDFTVLEKEAMVQMLKEAQGLYKQANTAHELLYDAQVVEQMSKICRQYAEDISLNTVKFHASEFAAKMATAIRGNSSTQEGISGSAWVNFADEASLAFVRCGSVESLFTAWPDEVEAPPKDKAKKETVRQRGRQKGEATKANVVDMDKADQQSNALTDTDKMVTLVYKQLVEEYAKADSEALFYFQFVIDPASFGRSVENIFYISFLVKEAKVKIFYDEETGLPKIQPMKKKKQRDPSMAPEAAQSLANKKQVIVPFSMDVWEKHIKAMGLVQAMIKR